MEKAPRTTHDIDVVVDMEEEDASRLVDAFPQPQYYLDKSTVIEAIRNIETFNLVEVTTGFKVGFWLLTGYPFDRSRFLRRYVEELEGFSMYVSTPEDTILMKLKWSKMIGGSEKQFTDVIRVYELQHGVLDMDYLERLATELEVTGFLERVKEESSPI